jgi:hypothetical protein
LAIRISAQHSFNSQPQTRDLKLIAWS